MKIIVTAIALAIAFPAAAQTAPAAGHDMSNMPMSGHDMGAMRHEPQADHSQHREQGGEGGCCADRDGDGRMDCCQHVAQSTDRRGCCAEHAPQAGAQPQAQHNH